MNDQELQIKILSIADTVGLEKASAALEKMANESESAGKASGKSSTEIRAMNAASAIASGNVLSMARATANLSTSLQGLQAAVPYIAAIAGAYQLLKTAIEKADAAGREHLDALHSRRTADGAANVEKIKETYDALTQSIGDAAQKAGDLAAAERSLATLAKEKALADEDLRLARELDAAADPSERQLRSAESAQRRAAIEGRYGEEEIRMERSLAEAAIAAATAKIIAAQDTYVNLATQYDQTSRDKSRYTGTAEDMTLKEEIKFLWSVLKKGREPGEAISEMRSGDERSAKYDAILKDILGAMTKAGKDIDDATRAISLAEARISEIPMRQGIHAAKSEASSIRADSSASSAGKAIADDARAREARSRIAAGEAEAARIKELIALKNDEKRAASADYRDKISAAHAAYQSSASAYSATGDSGALAQNKRDDAAYRALLAEHNELLRNMEADIAAKNRLLEAVMQRLREEKDILSRRD